MACLQSIFKGRQRVRPRGITHSCILVHAGEFMSAVESYLNRFSKPSQKSLRLWSPHQASRFCWVLQDVYKLKMTH